MVHLCCILLHREFPERISPYFYCTTKASRKFREYKRFRYFVKYSCAQENLRESTKSYGEQEIKCTA